MNECHEDQSETEFIFKDRFLALLLEAFLYFLGDDLNHSITHRILGQLFQETKFPQTDWTEEV